jgi:hypothetical protein
MDFIHGTFSTVGRFACRTVEDQFGREALTTAIDHSLPGERVVALLERLPKNDANRSGSCATMKGVCAVLLTAPGGE